MNNIVTPLNERGAFRTPTIGILIVAVVILLLFAAGFLWYRIIRTRTATLEYVSGEVQVTNPDAAGEWRMLSEDVRVRAGQQVRVAQDAVARLVFYDGSRIMLDAGARIMLQEVRGDWLASLNVVIRQDAGRTRHSVEPLHATGSGYQVVTPAGTATVVGTNFTIAIDESGYTRFSVDKGKVVVQNDAEDVTISSGQALVARNGVLEDQAAFQFSLSGMLEVDEIGTWSVNEVPFLVDTETLVKDNPQPGTPVFVEGRILGAQWKADFIMPLPGREALSSFTGILSQMEADTWVAGGYEVTLSTDIDIIGKPKEGDAVQVVFEVVPGKSWMANVIIALGETGEIPMLFATPTNTQVPTSILSASATPTPAPSRTPTYQPVSKSKTPTPKYQASPTSRGYTPRVNPSATPTNEASQNPTTSPSPWTTPVVTASETAWVSPTLAVTPTTSTYPEPTLAPSSQPSQEPVITPGATPSPTSTTAPSTVGSETLIIESDSTMQTFLCEGSAVTVTGNDNTIILLGTCRSLTVTGNANWIMLQNPTFNNNTGNGNIITTW